MDVGRNFPKLANGPRPTPPGTDRFPTGGALRRGCECTYVHYSFDCREIEGGGQLPVSQLSLLAGPKSPRAFTAILCTMGSRSSSALTVALSFNNRLIGP